MTVRKIIEDWLKEHGYDGLYAPGECACKIGDLAPCDSESVMTCRPGYLSPCDGKAASCPCDWHIGPTQTQEGGDDE